MCSAYFGYLIQKTAVHSHGQQAVFACFSVLGSFSFNHIPRAASLGGRLPHLGGSGVSHGAWQRSRPHRGSLTP